MRCPPWDAALAVLRPLRPRNRRLWQGCVTSRRVACTGPWAKMIMLVYAAWQAPSMAAPRQCISRLAGQRRTHWARRRPCCWGAPRPPGVVGRPARRFHAVSDCGLMRAASARCRATWQTWAPMKRMTRRRGRAPTAPPTGRASARGRRARAGSPAPAVGPPLSPSSGGVHHSAGCLAASKPGAVRKGQASAVRHWRRTCACSSFGFSSCAPCLPLQTVPAEWRPAQAAGGAEVLT